MPEIKQIFEKNDESSHCELKEQGAQIQKVSDRLEVTAPAPKAVVNP